MAVRNSERANRIIDDDQDGSMELKNARATLRWPPANQAQSEGMQTLSEKQEASGHKSTGLGKTLLERHEASVHDGEATKSGSRADSGNEKGGALAPEEIPSPASINSPEPGDAPVSAL